MITSSITISETQLVSINPAMVIGPLLQPTLNPSAAAVLSLIKGAQTFPNATFGWVNVKDVANAHIQAFENPDANGRYCLVERVAHYSEVVNILHDLYPDFQLPEKCADEKIFILTYKVSKEKAESLVAENRFIYAFLGLGTILCVVTCAGHMISEYSRP